MIHLVELAGLGTHLRQLEAHLQGRVAFDEFAYGEVFHFSLEFRV